jgi:hypothetical protein
MPPTERPPAARHAGPHMIVKSPAAPALLSPEASRRLREEAALVERFVECYGRRFDALIRRLNATPRAADPQGGPDAQSLRLCVEAVSMMLVTHGQMARALRHLGTSGSQPADAAARQPAARLAA